MASPTVLELSPPLRSAAVENDSEPNTSATQEEYEQDSEGKKCPICARSLVAQPAERQRVHIELCAERQEKRRRERRLQKKKERSSSSENRLFLEISDAEEEGGEEEEVSATQAGAALAHPGKYRCPTCSTLFLSLLCRFCGSDTPFPPLTPS
jgi:hypothetical protein